MAKKMKRFQTSLKEFLRNRSKDYTQYGRYLVQDMRTENMPLRLVSFFGDFIAMGFPILVLDYVFLLLTSGALSYEVFRFTSFFTDYLFMATIVVSNAVLIYLFRGQTFGKLALNFKVVSEVDNKEAGSKVLLMREVIGISVPILILYVLFGLLGIALFMVINGVFVLVDKKHRSIIDVAMKTKVVILNDKGKKHEFVVEKAEKPVEVVVAENKYDLHVYSSFSHDGEMEVEDILKKAQACGIQALSICDHNSVKANNLAQKIAPMYNIDYIPGINIDCDYEGHHIRLLGYFINSNDDRFIRIEYENLAKEKAVSARRIELFEEFSGCHVNTERLLRYNRFQIITEESIATDILANPEYRKIKLFQPYISGAKKETPIASFRRDFFAPGAPAYVPIIHPQAKDMIALIKACGGAVVLAHPMHSLGNYKETLVDLINEGLDGLEVFTPRHSVGDIKMLIPLVKEHNLYVSEGSEFHGPSRDTCMLGKTKCPKDVEDLVLSFINAYKERK